MLIFYKKKVEFICCCCGEFNLLIYLRFIFHFNIKNQLERSNCFIEYWFKHRKNWIVSFVLYKMKCKGYWWLWWYQTTCRLAIDHWFVFDYSLNLNSSIRSIQVFELFRFQHRSMMQQLVHSTHHHLMHRLLRHHHRYTVWLIFNTDFKLQSFNKKSKRVMTMSWMMCLQSRAVTLSIHFCSHFRKYINRNKVWFDFNLIYVVLLKK